MEGERASGDRDMGGGAGGDRAAVVKHLAYLGSSPLSAMGRRKVRVKRPSSSVVPITAASRVLFSRCGSSVPCSSVAT